MVWGGEGRKSASQSPRQDVERDAQCVDHRCCPPASGSRVAVDSLGRSGSVWLAQQSALAHVKGAMKVASKGTGTLHSPVAPAANCASWRPSTAGREAPAMASVARVTESIVEGMVA